MSYSLKTLREVIDAERKDASAKEKILYIIPYKEFNLSVPQSNHEVRIDAK